MSPQRRASSRTRAASSATRALAPLPVLGEVGVASPCNADGAKMTGDDRTRYCRKCCQNVYNLSEMSREQAEALIMAKHGQLCVR
jgi:hypothetical protein